LDTEMVPPERRLLTMRFEEATFEAVRVLSAPVMVTLSEEVIPAAERVPVDVRLRPWAVPVTTTEVPSIAPKEALVPSTSPVTVKEGPVREPPAESVPVIFTGPPTTRFAVASMLETEMVPGSLRLSRVPEVTFDAFRSFIPSPEPIKSAALSVEPWTKPSTTAFPVIVASPMTVKFVIVSATRFDVDKVAANTVPVVVNPVVVIVPVLGSDVSSLLDVRLKFPSLNWMTPFFPEAEALPPPSKELSMELITTN